MKTKKITAKLVASLLTLALSLTVFGNGVASAFNPYGGPDSFGFPGQFGYFPSAVLAQEEEDFQYEQNSLFSVKNGKLKFQPKSHQETGWGDDSAIDTDLKIDCKDMDHSDAECTLILNYEHIGTTYDNEPVHFVPDPGRNDYVDNGKLMVYIAGGAGVKLYEDNGVGGRQTVNIGAVIGGHEAFDITSEDNYFQLKGEFDADLGTLYSLEDSAFDEYFADHPEHEHYRDTIDELPACERPYDVLPCLRSSSLGNPNYADFEINVVLEGESDDKDLNSFTDFNLRSRIGDDNSSKNDLDMYHENEVFYRGIENPANQNPTVSAFTIFWGKVNSAIPFSELNVKTHGKSQDEKDLGLLAEVDQMYSFRTVWFEITEDEVLFRPGGCNVEYGQKPNPEGGDDLYWSSRGYVDPVYFWCGYSFIPTVLDNNNTGETFKGVVTGQYNDEYEHRGWLDYRPTTQQARNGYLYDVSFTK